MVVDQGPARGEPLDEFGGRTVSAGQGQFGQQARDAVGAGRDTDAARPVAERTSHVGLTGAGGGNENCLAISDSTAPETKRSTRSGRDRGWPASRRS